MPDSVHDTNAAGSKRAVMFDPDRDPDPVPSPCVQVCRLDADGRYCVGCLRTRGEIAEWRGMSESDKRRVWRLLAFRGRHEKGAP